MVDQLLGAILFFLGFSKHDIPSVKGETTEASTSATTSLTAKNQKTVNALKTKRAEFELKQQKIQTEIAARKAKAQDERTAKRAAFQEKIETIKDENKKALVETIQENFDTVNSNRTTAMTSHLTKMSDILKTIGDNALSLGKDISSLSTLIATAEKSISDALSAVSTQAGKSYSITITSEAKLKTDVEPVRKSLRTDLKATHEKIVAARKTVEAVIAEYKKLGGGPAKTAPPTPTPEQSL